MGETRNTPDQFASEVVHRWKCRVDDHASGTRDSRRVLREIIEYSVRLRDSLPPTPPQPAKGEEEKA